MSDASELFRNCFKYLGKSINDDLPELIKQAEAMLIKQKPNIKSFHEDNGQDLLLSGEVDVVMEYNGDIAQVMTEDDDLNFVVPKEGAYEAVGYSGDPERRASSRERAQVHQLHLGCESRGRDFGDHQIPIAETRPPLR